LTLHALDLSQLEDAVGRARTALERERLLSDKYAEAASQAVAWEHQHKELEYAKNQLQADLQRALEYISAIDSENEKLRKDTDNLRLQRAQLQQQLVQQQALEKSPEGDGGGNDPDSAMPECQVCWDAAADTACVPCGMCSGDPACLLKQYVFIHRWLILC
jgi:hypothetical protein